MTGALHRVGQFWRHSRAAVAGDERGRAVEILGPTLAPLFLELPVNDQRHGLDVLGTVTSMHPDASRLLQQAALLHDAGKREAHFSVVERSLTVFLKAVAPAGLAAIARGRPGFGRRLAIYEGHARVGADRLRGLGAESLAAIIEEHHLPAPALEETRRLQQADRRH